jgi:hypothetical protein
MVIKIEKKLSKTGKEYVGLWFENWLVTIDRRAIYKLVHKEKVKNMSVGDCIEFDIYEGRNDNFVDNIDEDDLPM